MPTRTPNNDMPMATSPLKDAMATELKGKPVSPYVKMMAGMAGGVVEACVLQPLDVTKTRLQLDRTGQYKGMVDCGKTIYRSEGGAALYKGLSPFIMHLTLKYALRFGSFAKFKELLGAGEGKKASNGVNFTAGLLTGCLESVLIVTPFEVIKTRLQQEVGVGRYKGPVDCLRKVVANEGITALWKGNLPTMGRQGSNQAFNFMAFAWLNTNVWKKEDGDGKTLEVWKTLVNGLVAGSLGPCLNSPMDVIKTRLMAQETIKGQEPKYRGFIHAFGVIAKEEGHAALWKGLVPRLTRMAPGQAITWTVVMRVTSFFENN
ncbi:Mitochondrial Carrier (MC) Family [Achlya hypogyna]|uniref:Mitochondrial Carrier (MC) Family n=1 Tax=Achlya hypogyna TaxID=1202772 RepID=A0A1V9YBB0_ACHHY|nr:Mitochondrial Carrier (MC) Family [Achlya hypogyna]